MNNTAIFPVARLNTVLPERCARAISTGENILLALVLAAIILLPLAEAFLRKATQGGIPGSAVLVQHLTLWASMLGAAVAAREGKLLTLFNVTLLAGGRAQSMARLASHLFASVVCGFLGLASLQLVLTERAAGGTIAFGIPVWTAELVLPLGFAVIGSRLAWHAASSLQARSATALLLTAILGSALWWTPHPDLLFYPGLFAIAGCALLGSPVFAVLAGTALFLFWQHDGPIASVALDHYRLVVNPTLPAIPLFTLAGFVLAASDAPQRLTRLFKALFGHFRGGVGIAAVVVGAFFTAFTGASGVTILALGGLLLPMLVGAGYRERDALGLVTGVGSLGVLIPPCLPLLLYAIVASVSVEQMFLAALVPGMLMVGIAAWWSARRDPRATKAVGTFNWDEARRAIGAAKWELTLPIVAFAGLLGGFATPVEAAALTAFYACVIEGVVYRDLRNPRRLVTVACDCGALIGGVLLILGVALGLTNYLVDIQLPEHLVTWATQTIHSKWLFLLALNVLLIAAGCLMDIFSAIVVVAPLVVPVGLAFGLDPLHLGVVFLANLEIGYLTPPVGVNLFYASSRFEKPITAVCRSVAPLLPVLIAGVLLITYIPWLSTALPGALR